MTLAWALVGLSLAAQEPSPQALVFYNARVALREDRPTEALRLWLLRNSLAQRGEPGVFDEDFRSVVWAALGSGGLCPDGFPRDVEGGAGLWPLSLHNHLVRNLGKGPAPDQPPPWDVFEAGRQQRFVSLHDVLSPEEHRSVAFHRTTCFLPQLVLLEEKQTRWLDMDDRLEVGIAMRLFLELSLTTLVREKVPNVALVEARLFDLDLALADLQARKARREAAERAQEARSLGASSGAATDVREQLGRAWAKDSRQAAFLRHSLTWSAAEWRALSTQRRLSLFAQAKPLATDQPALLGLVLAMADALAKERAGAELEDWLGFLDGADPAVRASVFQGARGQNLLELLPETGFRARAEVALHRGVAFLEAGARDEALRSFAYTLHHVDESRAPEATAALARRWLSYVLASYATNDELLKNLKALVPRQELNAVLEDLVWRAALRADAASFRRATEVVRRGGALDARVALLRPLSEGRAGELVTRLRDQAEEAPHATLRFVRAYLEALEVEPADVRRANAPTLKAVLAVLADIEERSAGKRAQARTVEELIRRAEAVLDGLAQLEPPAPGKPRALSLGRETFAGSIRLAPSDPLPWPYREPTPNPPSAFAPLRLQPVEWKDAAGRLVFGWKVTE